MKFRFCSCGHVEIYPNDGIDRVDMHWIFSDGEHKTHTREFTESTMAEIGVTRLLEEDKWQKGL